MEKRMINKQKMYSKQARFKNNGNDPMAFFNATITWVKKAEEEELPYAIDSRKRDFWLRNFVKYEPHLSGVLNTVIDIDKNRGWRVTGGRNQVLSFTNMFHTIQSAPGMMGWRAGISTASQAFWGSDIGAIVELGREGKDGPVRSLYTVDPAMCKLTGKDDLPLQHFNASGAKSQEWRWKDFIRVTSMPSTEEKYHGLGYCAVSRSLELARLMIAIYQHDKEQLGAQAPRGLLLLQGISQEQWDKAMEIRDAKLSEKQIEYYDALAVLASRSLNVDGKLIALSNLPLGFDYREWMDMLMYGYALIFGYDPSEFWPVQYGALGRGNEGTLQHEKATGKGRLDFVLGFQEQVQSFLPDSIEFTFDQRDEQGELLNAQIHKAWADVAKILYEAGQTTESGSLIRWAETRALLADWGMIPRSWAPTDDIESTDDEIPDEEPEVPEGELAPDAANTAKPKTEPATEKPINAKVAETTRALRQNKRELLMSNPAVVRAAQKFPKEPIVQYDYPANVVTELWPSGADLLGRKIW